MLTWQYRQWKVASDNIKMDSCSTASGISCEEVETDDEVEQSILGTAKDGGTPCISSQLFEAIDQGQIGRLRQLCCQQGNSINTKGENGNTMLMRAIQNHNVSMCQHLLELGCSMNAQNDIGRTALHQAIILGDTNCIQQLLNNRDISLGVADDEGWTELFWATKQGLTDTVKCILEMFPESINNLDYDLNTALNVAAKSQHREICQTLVKAGCDVNAANETGEFPLLLAVIKGNETIVEDLLRLGADCNQKTEPGVTPLLYAAICDHPGCTRLLLKSNADLNVCDGNMNNALMLAAKHSSLETVRELLSYSSPQMVNKKNNLSRTALYFAAERNAANIVELLLEHKADPCLIDVMGRLPLSVASQEGHCEAVAVLVRNKQGLNQVDFISMAPLHWAIVGGHVDCIKKLLESGADVNMPDEGSRNVPLILAVGYQLTRRATEMVRILLNACCNVNAVNSHERAAIHEAVERGCIEMVELLLAAGAAINMQAATGDTPIIIAARRGHTELMKILLNIDGIMPHLSIMNCNHSTALHEACRWGHSHIVRLLLAKGCEVNLEESDGDTPLILAATHGHDVVVELLLQHSGEINHRNSMDRSALLEAAKHGHTAVVDLLLQYRADVTATDVDGDSALTLAVGSGKLSTVSSLLLDGCHIHHCNKFRRNALHEACSAVSVNANPSGRIVERLLAAGIDPDLEDSMHSTPLILAMASGGERLIYPLLKANCDVNKPGKVQRMVRPIQVAVMKENFNAACMLYCTGCDMNAVNVWMDSPSGPQYMVPVSNPELRRWLIEVTSNPSSLKLKCRTLIRQCLGLFPATRIESLPLPQQVKDFLNLAELDAMVAEEDTWPVSDLMTCSITSDQDPSSYIDSDADISRAVSGAGSTGSLVPAVEFPDLF